MTYDECHLINELEKTKWAMETARSNFEHVVDPDLIDCYIYELQAVQMRYKFLLEKAKQSNISVSYAFGIRSRSDNSGL